MRKPFQFDRLWRRSSVEVLDALASVGITRRWLLRKAEKLLRKGLVEENALGRLVKVQEAKVTAIGNLLRSFERAISEGRISKGPRRKLLVNFAGNVMAAEADRIGPFKEKHGCEPPQFLTLAPTWRCNLKCEGCYSASSTFTAGTLSYDVTSRLLREQKESWGSYFTVISGGEPLLYRDSGKTILDLFEEHSDTYFLMYTNGTVIDEKMAERLAELGNVVPAISVEGLKEHTDRRRGEGTFERILRAMKNLRKVGVPFGVSMTASKLNADIILSQEVIDLYFKREGALFAWMFQYMPIGRSYTTELMLTPEERLALYHRTQELVNEQGLFMIDFWNSAHLSCGCMAAGRAGGYIYVNWNGDVTPCVFVPYAVENLNELYARDGEITEALFHPMFRRLRNWQISYGFDRPEDKVQNWIAPCPMRDHYEVMNSIVKKHGGRPIDTPAAEALEDEEYKRRMIEQGKRFKELSDPVWQRYCSGNGRATPPVEHEEAQPDEANRVSRQEAD